MKTTDVSYKSSSLLSPLAQHLCHLVEIDSSSQNILGVYKVQREIEVFLKNLDFEIQYYPHPTHDSAPLLCGYLNVNAPLTVSCIVHADTVLENEAEFKYSISEDQKRIYGPGVSDDKGGIVVALQSLLKFLSQESPLFNIQFISSPSEELGSPGFQRILKQLGLKSDILLGFEPSLPDGSIISSRNGNRWYNIEVLGKEAHSGRCQGEELNAALEISHKIIELSKLPQKIPGTKTHIGHILAGRDKYNVVCGSAHAKLDTRYDSFESSKHLHNEIINILNTSYLQAQDGFTSSTQWTIADDCPPMQQTDSQSEYCQDVLSIITQIESKHTSCSHSGGAADINYMSHPNAICIDGLGPVGGDLHTTSEYVELESLKTRTLAVTEFLKTINKKCMEAL